MPRKTKTSELSRHRLRVGDILFARRGAQATGLSAIVDERFEGALCGTGALLLRLQSPRIDPQYLAMFLSSETAYSWLRTHAVGAVMPNLNTAIIQALPVSLPGIHEQQRIAGFKPGEEKYQAGYAQHLRDALPNATFVGFTGTPVSSTDHDTRAVFGEYIHVYDMQQAKEDGATVAIYYESRLAKLRLKDEDLPSIDDEVDELAEDEEESQQAKLKSRWAALEKIVGAEPRVASVAADLVAHFEERSTAQSGKAMVVAMSRDICVHLYNEIIKLRPDWHDPDPEKGAIKIVMTGSASDKALLRPHIYDGKVKKRLEKRFKDPPDPLRLVIVRDMWLTGFDAPCVHTLYVDKPMKGHNLMQAIARVNRVFKGKQGGLVVDYIGIGNPSVALWSSWR